MISVKLIGGDKLKSKLQPETIKKPLKDGLAKMTYLLERLVKQATPVDTGKLKSGIFSKIGENEGLVATHVAYAEFVEYGTPRMDERHMEGGAKIVGKGVKGMFAFGLEQLKKKMPDQLRDIGVKIERRFGS